MTNGEYRPLWETKETIDEYINEEGHKITTKTRSKDLNETKFVRINKWFIITFLTIIMPSAIQYIQPILQALAQL